MMRAGIPFGMAAALLLAGEGRSQTVPAEARKLDYYADVRPILTIHCYRCHSADSVKGGLRLDVRELAFQGGQSGDPAIVPGKSGESLLVRLVASSDPEERMPRKAPRLEAGQIAILRRWVDEGAEWPEAAAVSHWAFRPPRRPPTPEGRNRSWVRTPVDAFIAREHEARGVAPAPEAPRRTLLRRLALDLTGLPPGPAEIEAFLADDSSDAVEKAVDRLLASPQYGERWGRHWLDFARFAETSGYEANALRPAAWRYRDYVVRSFNEDKPYDLFLRQQLAGDEMTPLSDENLVATGFLAHGRLDNNQEDRAVQRNDHLVDIVNATAAVAFGVQFACAQCHDHKWDPFTHRDYYRFMGFFVRGQVNNLQLKDPRLWKAYEAAIPPELEPARTLLKILQDRVKEKLSEEAKAKLPRETLEALETPAARRTPEQQKLAKEAEKALQFSKEQVEKATPEGDKALVKELEKKVEALQKRIPEKPHAWGFYSPATSPHKPDMLPIKGFYPMLYNEGQLRQARPRLLKRGDPRQAGPEVEIGWPAVLGPTPPEATTRTALAEWLASPRQPLTARVWVNYVWQLHFGRGLVETPGDFGLRGARPTHPELLDWLAVEFMEGGWSTKRLHRLILLSSTWRQASRPDGSNERIDPRNRLYWRWSPRRLEAEAIRDSVLAVSGELDRTMGGASIPDKPAHLEEFQAQEPKMGDPTPYRRTMYYTQRRHAFPEAVELFDGPQAGESCPKRYVSTVSLQSLYLMNNPWVMARVQAFAARVRARAGDDRSRQVEEAFVLALGRPPSGADREAVGPFLASYGDDSARALLHLCHALVNLNEFLYVE
jgi:hypothetical protein